MSETRCKGKKNAATVASGGERSIQYKEMQKMTEHENCSHECGSCGEECASRTQPFSFKAEPNPLSSVGKVIGVVSGKGGVGKS